MSAPWFKFYPSDWRADPALRMCSIGARGLWMEMLCVMHEAEPRGSLLVNGNPVSDRQLAGLAGCSLKEVSGFLEELEAAGVFSRDNGAIFSRRMRRDDEKAARDKANGMAGGNPSLKRGVNPPDKAQKPEARDQISDADASDARRLQPQVVSDADLQPASVSMAPPAPERSHAEAFARFWQVYPHKVGKQDAEKAFNSVMKRGAVTLDRMLAALDRYMRTKPPDRPWCNPATWLRQGRWDDEPGPDPIQRGPFPPAPPGSSGPSSRLTAVVDWVRESTGGGAPPEAPGSFRFDGGAEGDRSGDVLPLGPTPRSRFAG